MSGYSDSHSGPSLAEAFARERAAAREQALEEAAILWDCPGAGLCSQHRHVESCEISCAVAKRIRALKVTKTP
jgi:hypothetical protein